MASSFRVEPGHVLVFNRIISGGDSLPAPGESVPPTFMSCSSQQDPAHMRGLQPVGSMTAFGADAQGVLHAQQRFEYFAPVRVGDVVSVTERRGRSWTKRGSSGDLEFLELVKDVSDPDGRLLQRSTMTLVRSGASA